MNALALALAAALALAPPQHLIAEGLPCHVLRVLDGDTFDCAGGMRVRVADIDAPGIGGAAVCREEHRLGRLAATATAAWIEGRDVVLWPAGHDSWDRLVAHVEIGGGDLGTRLLDAALARPWPHDATGRALTDRPDWCEE